MNVFDLFAKIELDNDGYLRSLDEAENRTNNAGGKMGDQFRRVGALAATGTVAAAGAITAMVTTGVREFASLEQGMNEVFTLMPGLSDEAMQQMTDDVQAFATEAGITTDEVVPALYNSISAGVPEDNVFAFLETANELAVGGVTDINTAVDGLTSATNAYGSEILNAEEAADIMFTAVKDGKTTIDEISNSIGNIAPLASDVNVGFDEVNAAISTLTSQGLGTSEAVTGIRSALTNILTPAGDMQTAMKNIVTELVNQNELSGPVVDQYKILQDRAADLREQMVGLESDSPEFKELQTALEDTNSDMGDLASTMGPAIIQNEGLANTFDLIEQQATGGRDGLSKMFGSVEGLNAVLALTSEEGSAAFQGTLDSMAESSGATKDAFETMDQGITRNFDRLKSIVEVFLTEIGERFAPVIEDALEEAVNFFETFSTNVIAFIDSVTGGYTEGFDLMSSTQETALGTLESLWDSFYAALESLFELLVTLYTETLQPGWDAMQPWLSALLDGLVIVVEGMFAAFELAFDTFNALLSGDYEGAWTAFEAFASSIFDTLAALITTLTDGWQESFETFVGYLGNAVQNGWNEFVSFLEGVRDDILAYIVDVIAEWRQDFNDFIDFLVGPIENSFNSFQSFIEDLTEGFSTAFSDAIGIIEGVIEPFTNLLTGDFSGAFDSFSTAGTNALNAIENLAETVFGSLSSLATDGVNGVGTALNDLNGLISNAFTAVTNFVTGAFTDLSTGVTNVFNDAVEAVTTYVNNWIDTVNNVITRINDALEVEIPDVGIDIPDWVPGIGGRDLDINTPDINPPDIPPIPALARGGVVDDATLALIGEAGPEAVVPLERYNAMAGLGTAAFGSPQVVLADAFNAFDVSVDRFGDYVDRLVTEGIAVNVGAASRTAALR